MECCFCGKICKNANSLRNHERCCKLNPNKFVQSEKFYEAMAKRRGGSSENQYTKARKLGLPKPEISPDTKEKLANAVLARSKEWNAENGKKISESIKRKVEEGTWHTSLARKMHINYNGADLHGSWELAYAKFLDANNINWVRNTESFPYEFRGKTRRYTPDFFLVDTGEYVEIKGFQTEKDEAKWRQFPKDKKLVILKQQDLKLLQII